MLPKNKYGISKPQINHLNNLIHGLITVHDNKSISSISKSVLTARDSSCIYRFLSTSVWDDNLVNRNRIKYLNLILEQQVKPESIGFLIIDDTVNPKPRAKKTEELDYHFIGAVKSNRLISPKGIKLQLSQFAEYIGPNALSFFIIIKGGLTSPMEITQGIVRSYKVSWIYVFVICRNKLFYFRFQPKFFIAHNYHPNISKSFLKLFSLYLFNRNFLL